MTGAPTPDDGGAGMSDTARFCGCAGCIRPASVVVAHPDHGERVVCERHGAQFDIVREVDG